MDLKYLKDNILSNRWKQRDESLSKEVKEKLESLNNSKTEEYQLQVIQRKRSYPEVGDIFQLNPRGDIFLKGIVVNNHINNINGDDLILVFIFKPDSNVDEILKEPELLGTYGVSTITGIAKQVNQELIILGAV